MATSAEEKQHKRKRQHNEAGILQDQLPSLPSKKFKRPPTFWDNLSKIPLTRSALKELERRNTLSDRSCVQPEAKTPGSRGTVCEFKQKAQCSIPVSEYLPKASQADITLLESFAKQGGPDLSDLRGYSRHTMSSREARLKRQRSVDPSSMTSKSKKSTTPYDRGFEQNLVDHGVYLDNRVQKPNNWEEIQERLAIPRSSLSPSKFSEAAFSAFRASDFRAKDEDDVMIDVIPVITGAHEDPHFSARKTKFANLDPLTDGTMPPANPYLYYGARPEQLDRKIRDKLMGHIIPSSREDKPMAPNYYFEAKGPDGSFAVARRQACYDGAIGARGMQSLQSYGQNELVYDNCAYTIASIYLAGQLKMYTTHITPPTGPGKPPEYQWEQLGAWALTGALDQFRIGVTAFRNGRDLTKEWRDGFISTANDKLGSLKLGLSILESSNCSGPSDTIAASPIMESETSSDEHTALPYPVEEPETAADEIVFTSSAHPVEDEISEDELALLPYVRPGKTREA